MPLYVATSTLHTPSKGEPLPGYCTAYSPTFVQCFGLCHHTRSLLCVPSIQAIFGMSCKGL